MIAIDRVRWDRLGIVGSAACMVHCLAVLAEETSGMPGLDKPLTVLGGVVLIAAHALNIKLCRACPVCRTEAAQEA